ncbi:MAG: dTDP-4-dehydrorhamnose 3,5-epimerase [Beijerinckiaceae bacterium]
MRITPTPLAGLFVVDITPIEDPRGFFARTYDADAFRAAGLPADWPQHSISFNRRRGTLRGMHYQADPKPEPKLVRCTRGSVFDVAVDIRPTSPTHRRWFGLELTAERRNALYIPAGFAHGFVTLEDDSELLYQIGERYDAPLARGLRWNDTAFAIDWPIPPEVMSERDAAWPDYAG